MLRFLLRRLAVAAMTSAVAVLCVFVAVRWLPNNPVLVRFGQHAVPAKVADEMARHGWDQPIAVQAARFFWGLVTRGDLGVSFQTGESVAAGLARTLPATIELTLAALAIAVPLGLAAGIVAALWRGRWPDMACTALSLVGTSVPVFFLGIALIVAFPGMPTGRRLPIGAGFDSVSGLVVIESLLRGQFHITAEAIRYLCLPAIALSTIPAAIIARVTRASLIEVLSADFLRTARAKGAGEPRVILAHALPNAAIPVANIGALQLGQLLGGAVLTESVFEWPGLGRYLVEAVLASDYAVVQGGALVVSIVFVSTNLAADVLYGWLDPRVRLGEAAHA